MPTPPSPSRAMTQCARRGGFRVARRVALKVRPAILIGAFIVAAATAGAQPLSTREWLIAGRLTQGGIVFGTAPPGTVRVTVDGAPVRLTGDRRFLAGFGRDAPPEATLVATLADGSREVRVVPVARRHYDIESIPSLRPPPPDAPPDPVYDARRAVELAAIRDARAGDVAAVAVRRGVPVVTVVVTSTLPSPKRSVNPERARASAAVGTTWSPLVT